MSKFCQIIVYFTIKCSRKKSCSLSPGEPRKKLECFRSGSEISEREKSIKLCECYGKNSTTVNSIYLYASFGVSGNVTKELN